MVAGAYSEKIVDKYTETDRLELKDVAPGTMFCSGGDMVWRVEKVEYETAHVKYIANIRRTNGMCELFNFREAKRNDKISVHSLTGRYFHKLERRCLFHAQRVD